MNINFNRIISVQKTTKLFIALMLFLLSFSLSPSLLAATSADALWAKSVTGGPMSSGFSSVAEDASGNVYAGGVIGGIGTCDFGNGVTVSGTYGFGNNLMLVKYDSAGSALWAKSVTSRPSSSRFLSVAADTSGNVYAGGVIDGTGTYDFGNGVTASGMSDGSNIVLVKYDSTGTALWAKSVASEPSLSVFTSVTVDASGNVYAAGYIHGGTYDFGNGVTASGTSGSANVILVKYDSTGTALWAKSVASGSLGSVFTSVTVDGSGNVYAAGFIEGTAAYDFGNGVTASGSGASNIVLVKYDSTGTGIWAKSVTSGFSSMFSSITVDGSGNVHACGYIWGIGTCDFGNGVTVSVASSAGSNAVLVKYDSTGTTLWAKNVTSGPSSSSFLSVTADTSGNVYAGGNIYRTGTYDFGNGVTASGTSGTNVVLVKYDSIGTTLWAKSVIGSSGSRFPSVTVDASGNVYACGDIDGTGIYDFGNGVTASGTYGGSNLVLVKYSGQVSGSSVNEASSLKPLF